MTIVKRIDPASAFKIGLVTHALVGFIAGVFCSLIALTGASFVPHARMPLAGTIGALAVIVCPIVYEIIGCIATVIAALIYNLSSRWVYCLSHCPETLVLYRMRPTVECAGGCCWGAFDTAV